MTDNDIIKALECCITLDGKNFDICEKECPYKKICWDVEKGVHFLKDILNLINRIQKDKEYYKNNRNEYQDKVMFISKQCDELQEENSRQKAEIEMFSKSIHNLSITTEVQMRAENEFQRLQIERVKQARAEAITEFAERLKGKLEFWDCGYCGDSMADEIRQYTFDTINQIAKEMKGEQ